MRCVQNLHLSISETDKSENQLIVNEAGKSNNPH